MKKVTKVHSYISSKPVHGITWWGTNINERPRDSAAATKQIKIEIAPKCAGSLECAPVENCHEVKMTYEKYTNANLHLLHCIGSTWIKLWELHIDSHTVNHTGQDPTCIKQALFFISATTENFNADLQNA